MKYNAIRLPQHIVKKQRGSFNKKAFIRFCAYKGFFDDVFDKRELKQAIKGNLPSYADVHHIKLLSTCINPNEFDNLCVISKSKHKKVHELIDKQLVGFYDEEVGYIRQIEVPSFDMVDKESILMAKRLLRGKFNEVCGSKKR